MSLPSPRPLNRRLDPDARRRQLLEAGFQMIQTRPYSQVTADEVARAVGVSKGLVFHYFPTNRDLQVAVVRVAAGELLSRLNVDPELPTEQRLGAGLDAFVGFIETQPANYLAVARSVGSDPALLAVFEETRSAVVDLILAAIGLADSAHPGLRIVVRGWIAMVEESVLHWLEGSPVPRDQLLGFLQRAAATMLPDALITFSGPAAGEAAGVGVPAGSSVPAAR
ncbi:MAG: TetR/AcrR family transcriptional regulator [Actinomycetota bacterium]|nr:TetR/AcrR family transcriptional regulator [Actinomycetota bacterium]